jgi:trimethylamine--corrinoid protein Co-methyltransferase
LAVLREFIRAGQPVCIASMPMVSGTAPVTLAGAIALANAELLAGNVITQQLEPGTPVLYGGIPHVLDPRTTLCSFGAPEQALMAVGMTQLGRHYGFPVYINVGLTDAKVLDLQAGIEKGATLALGALAGADLVGHAGIRGADHGASLLWLCADNELLAYVKRMNRGVEVSPNTLATDIIHAIQPGGNFLAEAHTVKHLRQELWLPGAPWSRQAFGAWESAGRLAMGDRLRSEVQRLLQSHQPVPPAPDLSGALDEIVNRARAAFA